MATGRLARGARITGAERDRLVVELTRRYDAGESIRSIASDLGRSYGFVQGLLKDAGVGLRTRGGPTRGAEAVAARQATLEAVAAVRAEYAAGGLEPAPPVPGTKEAAGRKPAGKKPAAKDGLPAKVQEAKPAKGKDRKGSRAKVARAKDTKGKSKPDKKSAKGEKSGKGKKSAKGKKSGKGKKK